MTGPVPRDGRHARSHSTRESILLTAERLFAEFGIAAISFKDISVAAGQKNNGVIQYHFGDRENLIQQIIAYRAKTTEEVREALLEEIVAKKGRPQVRDYVGAFVESLASQLAKDNYFLRLQARLVIEWGNRPYASVPESKIAFLKSEMLALMPHMSEAVLEQRWHIMTSATVQMLANFQAAKQANELKAPVEELLDDLVSFLTAGLLAPIRQLPKSKKGDGRLTGKSVAMKLDIDDTPKAYTNKKRSLKHNRTKNSRTKN
jgi:AcrR family transcriptional regulator